MCSSDLKHMPGHTHTVTNPPGHTHSNTPTWTHTQAHTRMDRHTHTHTHNNKHTWAHTHAHTTTHVPGPTHRRCNTCHWFICKVHSSACTRLRNYIKPLNTLELDIDFQWIQAFTHTSRRRHAGDVHTYVIDVCTTCTCRVHDT